MPPFSKVLVANRGEIAIRVFRTLRELGSGRSRSTPRPTARAACRDADEAYCSARPPGGELPRPSTGSSKRRGRPAPRRSTPGTGSWPRTPDSRAPSRRRARVDRSAARGDRGDGLEDRGTRAHARGRRADRPRHDCTVESAEDVFGLGGRARLSARVKAAAGGGGKGLRSSGPPPRPSARSSRAREGEAYFADATVYVERYLDDPRHVEVQVLADAHGQCSTSASGTARSSAATRSSSRRRPRRPSAPSFGERIGALAVNAARAVGYRSAGTIEGLLDPSGDYWFLEMNTRIQVEQR